MPHLPPMPLFENTFKMLTRLKHKIETLNRIYQKFSKIIQKLKICGFYRMKTPFLMIHNPELINKILISDFTHFTDHGFYMDTKLNIFGRGLFFLNSQKWKIMRHKLSPGFTSGKIKGTYDQIK